MTGIVNECAIGPPPMTELPAHTIATYRTIEMHTAGEPVRLVLEGFPEPRGATVLEKRNDAAARLDVHRRRLMLEPRGHAEMYGALPVEPRACARRVRRAVHAPLRLQHHVRPCDDRARPLGGRHRARADCVMARADFILECPCGPVAVHVPTAAPRSRSTACPPSPPHSTARWMFPASAVSSATSATAARSMPSCRRRASASTCTLRRWGSFARRRWQSCDAIRARGEVRHPTEPDLSFLYGAILTDDTPPGSPRATRNFCVFGEGQIDRSATGSGVTARMAVDAARGLIVPSATRAFAGASGVPFHAELLGEERLGAHRAWRVRVAGTASFSGTATWIVEETDALRDGFAIEDPSPLPPR